MWLSNDFASKSKDRQAREYKTLAFLVSCFISLLLSIDGYRTAASSHLIRYEAQMLMRNAGCDTSAYAWISRFRIF